MQVQAVGVAVPGFARPSWSGSSRSSTSSFDEGGAQDVDARHKGEHDGSWRVPCFHATTPSFRGGPKGRARPPWTRRSRLSEIGSGALLFCVANVHGFRAQAFGQPPEW